MSHICEWVTSRVRISRVTSIKIYVARYGLVMYMNVSRHAYTWVTACVWISRGMRMNGTRMNGTRMNASRHAYEWVALRVSRHMLHDVHESKMWMSHGTRINWSRNAYKWVTACVWMSRVTCSETHVARYGGVIYVNEYRHAYRLVTERVWMSHGMRMNESRYVYWDICCTVWMSYVCEYVIYIVMYNARRVGVYRQKGRCI